MIHITFEKPNFICEVEDQCGNVEKELHYAPDESHIKTRLDRRIKEGLIKRIVSISANDFSEWELRAKAETENAINTYKSGAASDYSFRSKLYGELKSFLITLFHGKCAYCEADFTAVAWGDVEHYRPKRRVTDEQGKLIPLPDGTDRPHPGYYWLAYDYKNLLPSCQLCNQGKGKMNQFPIQDERHRALSEFDDISKEIPLLLNPCDPKHEPRNHIQFLPSRDKTVYGTVAALTDLGKRSIDVYRLNREPLIVRRREEQSAIRARLKERLAQEDKQGLVAIIEQCKSGTRAFSSAAWAEVNSYFESMGLAF